jgi:hypothetical protein
MARYKIGESGNPAGRAKGAQGGRMLALGTLDRFMGKAKNQKKLAIALEKFFDEDPVRFFKTMIMPLLPREAKVQLNHDGIVQWQGFLGVSGVPPPPGESGRPAPSVIDADIVEPPSGVGLPPKTDERW